MRLLCSRVNNTATCNQLLHGYVSGTIANSKSKLCKRASKKAGPELPMRPIGAWFAVINFLESFTYVADTYLLWVWPKRKER